MAGMFACTQSFLNEVLSLNAQEYLATTREPRAFPILNEVLSLNAQEFTRRLSKALA